MCCVCWHIQTSENYLQVWKIDGGVMRMYPSYTSTYQDIPSYDGIWRYMSGYQGVRIPDGSKVPSQTWCTLNADSMHTSYRPDAAPNEAWLLVFFALVLTAVFARPGRPWHQPPRPAWGSNGPSPPVWFSPVPLRLVGWHQSVSPAVISLSVTEPKAQ